MRTGPGLHGKRSVSVMLGFSSSLHNIVVFFVGWESVFDRVVRAFNVILPANCRYWLMPIAIHEMFTKFMVSSESCLTQN